MKALWLVPLLAIAVIILLPGPREALRSAASSAKSRIMWTRDVGRPDLSDHMLGMSDGVRLATDVYLPRGVGPHPTVLIRLPYGKSGYPEVRFWTGTLRSRGFAVVVQDMRGRGRSEGVFAPYPNAVADGTATLDWISAQDWSTGRVGTLGCSALGESQVILAAAGHPAHAVMIPMAPGGAAGTVGDRYSYFGAFEGGIFNLASGFGWFASEGYKTPDAAGGPPIDYAALLPSLPVATMVERAGRGPTDFADFLENFENRAYWRDANYVDAEDRIETPGLFIDTWHDPSISSTLALADLARRSGVETRTIIGAGLHCDFLATAEPGSVGDVAIEPDRRMDYVGIVVDILRHHLSDGPAPDLPAYAYYMLVEDRWRSADAWPPPEAAPVAFRLSSEDAALVPEDQSVAGQARSFVSDPFDPVPTIGGAICCTGDPASRAGPLDQRPIETRDDILIYTSEPLSQPLRIAGPVSADLSVSTDVPDTDLVLRLTDVHPDGRSITIQEGALRLRYRAGFEDPRPMIPGEVERTRVHMRDIAYMIGAGHRLRLHIAGSSFPRLERNLNTGAPNHSATTGRKARITVHSAADNPSTVELFVLPD